MADQVFWRAKKLAQMSAREFELLCDGCGKCCLHKLEDEDNGDVYYTKVACRLLDHQTCRCQNYTNRKTQVPDCVVLTPDTIKEMYWLPETCAYKLIDQGIPLFDWHPLVSGDPNSVHQAGMSVANLVIAEDKVDLDDLEDYVVRWV